MEAFSPLLLLLALAAKTPAGHFFQRKLRPVFPEEERLMPRRPTEILVVEQDADVAEMISQCLGEAIQANLSHTRTGQEALHSELTHRHDLIIASFDLPDGDILDLMRQLRVSNKCPVILIADNPTPAQLVEAMKLGLRHVLLRPFDMVELAEVARSAIRAARQRRYHRLRYHRLRLLTARIIRERRDLRQRVDLICQDVVRSYRNLAHKVAESGVLTQD